MDKTVPPAAGKLLDLIASKEAPNGYNTVFANQQHRLPKPLTQMTIGQILAAGPTWAKKRPVGHGSSACGRYQFMAGVNHTLSGLVKELRLSPSQVFTPDLQDRLGYHLLRRRGYDLWAAGKMSHDDFMINIGKEWASFPMPYRMRGKHGIVERGQSYYAGDQLNRAGIGATEVWNFLDKLRKQAETEVPPILVPPPLDTSSHKEDAVLTFWSILTKAAAEYFANRKAAQP